MNRAKFILSKSKLKEQLKQAYELADEVSYSLKTNYGVGKILEEESKCQFSVHSLKAVHELNSPERVWFFAQAWNKEELNNLLKFGVNSFVVDNEKDLNVLLENTNKKINLLLRTPSKFICENLSLIFFFSFLIFKLFYFF